MTDLLCRLFSSALIPLWEMSLAAAWAAGVVFLLRLILKNRAPRQAVCLLWLIVFARLLLPFSLQAPFSAVPQAVAHPSAVTQTQPAGQEGLPSQMIQSDPQPEQTGQDAPSAGDGDAVQPPRTAPFPWQALLAGVWLAGAAAMAGYALASYLILRRRLFDATRAPDGAWEHPDLATPFLLGVVRPRICLPAHLAGPQRFFVLCHERAHLRRGDHIVKPICYLALSLHWFNPAAWVAFTLLSQDLEAACDQAVIRGLGERYKADYSAALLQTAAPRRFPTPCPLAFGGGGARARIRGILNYKKPAFWVLCAVAALVAAAAAVLLTDPMAARPGGEDPAPDSSTPALSEEPPLSQDDLARAVPDFLTPEQQQLYRRACSFYTHLFGGETGAVEYSEWLEEGAAPLPEEREQVDIGGYTYWVSYGLYADYARFDAVRASLFTDEFWQARNALDESGTPIFTEHEGRLCYLDMSRGSGYYRNSAFPDTFTLVSESEEEIVFTVRGYYLEVWPPEGTSQEEWDAYRQENFAGTLSFTLRLVNTPEGWRFDQFYETTADESSSPASIESFRLPDRVWSYTNVSQVSEERFTFSQEDQDAAVQAVEDYLERERAEDYTISLSIQEVAPDPTATARCWRQYFAPESVFFTDWSEEAMLTEMMAVTAIYTAEYDGTKTFLNSGTLSTTYSLIKTPWGWIIWTQNSPVVLSPADGT